MSIVQIVSTAFSEVLANPVLSDDEIRAVQDPMELPAEKSLLEFVPCYMLFCAKYPGDNSLVAYHTVNALAEYGRANDPDNDYLNFKFQCDHKQQEAVALFLRWAKGAPNYEDETQIDRAFKRRK